MKKLSLFILAAAGLWAGASLAQDAGSAEVQYGRSGTTAPQYGPAPGTPEYYGNSGYVPPPQRPLHRNKVYRAGPYSDSARHDKHRQLRDRDRDRDRIANRNDRDRDGDGYVNRRDRYPDDPRRH